MSPDAYALNEEIKKLLVERDKLRAALIEIWDLIPNNPKLPLVYRIQGVVLKALKQ